MPRLSSVGQRIVEAMSERHGFDADAVGAMLEAVAQGRGTQAQFNHPAFGGMGQWSQGGMTMVGDMFNHGLKARVDGLCRDLSSELGSADVFEGGAQAVSGRGWPAALGRPAAEGAQNNMRYAYFPETARLAVSVAGKISVYDTGEHRIGGFGQSQGGGQDLSFSSQNGTLRLSDLKLVDPGHAPALEEAERGENHPRPLHGAAIPGTPRDGVSPRDPAEDRPQDPRERTATLKTPPRAQEPPAPRPAPTEMSDEQIFSRLERLADFRDRGILDDAEFAAKKAELLARL